MLVTAVYFFMPVNYITLCSEPLRCRSVLSRSVSKVFPLLKHILCTAGRKQIPEDCVEIVTPPSCLVHTHTQISSTRSSSSSEGRECFWITPAVFLQFPHGRDELCPTGPLIPVELCNSMQSYTLSFCTDKENCY